MSISSEFINDLNGFGGVFVGGFSDASEVLSLMGPGREWGENGYFEADLEHPKYIKREGLFIVYARYDEEAYEGSAVVFFDRDGVLYETRGSHCSCYGLENTWDEGETVTVEFLREVGVTRSESHAYGFSDKFDYTLREYVKGNDVWYSELMVAIEAYEQAKAQSASSTGSTH